MAVLSKVDNTPIWRHPQSPIKVFIYLSSFTSYITLSFWYCISFPFSLCLLFFWKKCTQVHINIQLYQCSKIQLKILLRFPMEVAFVNFFQTWRSFHKGHSISWCYNKGENYFSEESHSLWFWDGMFLQFVYLCIAN